MAKHRTYAEAEAAKKQLLAKLGGEAAPGGAPPSAAALDPLAAIDVVVELCAAEAGKAGLSQQVVDAVKLLRDMLVKKDETKDQGNKENKQAVKMDVDGGAAGGGAGSAAAAAASGSDKPTTPPSGTPPAERPSPAAAPAADQWTFSQCEMAYARAGVVGKLLAAKNQPRTATYSTKEVEEDWREHDWKGTLASCRNLLGSKKSRTSKGDSEDKEL